MASGQGTSLKSYLLTRIALVVPMVLILLTFVFLLMRVAPGRPDLGLARGTRAAGGDRRRSRRSSASTSRSGSSTWQYLGNIFRGDFGTTITDQRPVSDIILE